VSHVEFLAQRLTRKPTDAALVWKGRTTSNAQLVERLDHARNQLAKMGIGPGAVVSLEADFSPSAVGWLLASIDLGCVVVPLTFAVEAQKPELRAIVSTEFSVTIDADDRASVLKTGMRCEHALVLELRHRGHPGLVLFSSGSTGKSKAALHDLVPFLEKYKVPRRAFRTIGFLLFDHIGGINTLLYALANSGTVVVVAKRTPESVCRAIEEHKVNLLPTSPTFLNLLMVSDAIQSHDLSSLEVITYGTEPMPESLLKRVHATFPRAKLQQTYGLSEVGILRSKSRSDDSLWMKIGGEGFETRVVDGMLEIKAQSAMMGYFNHPSPFTTDGWFRTGDLVEQDGEYFRVLGRASELINVGGEKVFPAEVEGILGEMPGVLEVTVSGERNMLTGQLVRALVRLSGDESTSEFRMRMRAYCQGRLAPYKIPQKVVLADTPLHSERFKKSRSQ
jgi:acyl-coenzyme A synthetase/AMP-(fatty) acid ligase